MPQIYDIWTIYREEKSVGPVGIPAAVRQVRSLVAVESTVVGRN